MQGMHNLCRRHLSARVRSLYPLEMRLPVAADIRAAMLTAGRAPVAKTVLGKSWRRQRAH